MNTMQLIRTIAVALIGLVAFDASAQDVKLQFKEGEQNRLNIIEKLRITLYQPQVDEEYIEPSIRTFDYSFRETVEKVFPDGSAKIAVTLDSFKTETMIGEGRNAQEFFRFNSSDDYDLRTNFRDIKAYPRAQFLGQTLRFTIGSDGLVRNFENLTAFQAAAQGKGFDYDMVRAILALADTLRMAQLFEQSFGGIAALGNDAYADPSMMTEIPITRLIQSERKGDSIFVTTRYINPPERIEYLEGIAIPIALNKFNGSGKGKSVVKKGTMTWGQYSDSTTVTLDIGDTDVIPYKVVRDVTIKRHPIELAQGIIGIKETEQHRGVPVAPEIKAPDGAKEIELPGATIDKK